jgi:hypothetical protein
MLCDEMETITRRLMLTAPKGSGITLFRTTRGRAWKRCNSVQRFLELKKKLGLPENRCMYTCRHTFAKRTLSGYYTGKPVPPQGTARRPGDQPRADAHHAGSGPKILGRVRPVEF